MERSVFPEVAIKVQQDGYHHRRVPVLVSILFTLHVMPMSIVELILISALLTQIVFQFFIVVGMRRGATARSIPEETELPPLSIMVTAKNESENLLQCVPSILRSEYPDFELILVNDLSTDNTVQVMKAFEEQDPRVRMVDISSDRYNQDMASGKKFALTLGIKAAKNDFIVLTDADCVVKEDWLDEMGYAFAAKGSVLIGTGNYKSSGMIGALHSAVNFRFSQQYLVANEFALPFGAVGRSMGIDREVFFQVQGFKDHMSIPSGSDDFPPPRIIGKGMIVNVPRAVTESQSPRSISAWIRQRSRHVKASIRYKWSHKILLAIYELSNVIALMSILYAIIFKDLIGLLLISLFLFRLLLSGVGIYLGKKLFDHPQPTVQLMLLEYPGAILNSLFSGIGLLTKPTEWIREK